MKARKIVSRGIDARARVPLEYLPLATVFCFVFFCCLFVCFFYVACYKRLSSVVGY